MKKFWSALLVSSALLTWCEEKKENILKVNQVQAQR